MEAQIKQRVRAIVSSPRKVSINRLGGFAVEQEKPVEIRITGDLKKLLGEDGMLRHGES